LFSIRDKLFVPVRKLSLGERMKMELILAILHEPDLLFLDEPTIGLDFNAAKQIRSFLKEANARLGITVVLTSHYAKDIEELCRRVILINYGQIVYDGALQGLDQRLQGQKIISLVTSSRERAEELGARLSSAAVEGEAPFSPRILEDGVTLEFDFPHAGIGANLLRLFNKVQEHEIIDLKVGDRPLEDIFSEIYRKPSGARQ